jgi:hypothetical protein
MLFLSSFPCFAASLSPVTADVRCMYKANTERARIGAAQLSVSVHVIHPHRIVTPCRCSCCLLCLLQLRCTHRLALKASSANTCRSKSISLAPPSISFYCSSCTRSLYTKLQRGLLIRSRVHFGAQVSCTSPPPVPSALAYTHRLYATAGMKIKT